MKAGGFIRSRAGVEHPDIQFHFLPSQVMTIIMTMLMITLIMIMIIIIMTMIIIIMIIYIMIGLMITMVIR